MSEPALNEDLAEKMEEWELWALRPDLLAIAFQEFLKDKAPPPSPNGGFQAELDSVREAFIKDPKFVMAKATTEAARMEKRHTLLGAICKNIQESCVMLKEHNDIKGELLLLEIQGKRPRGDHEVWTVLLRDRGRIDELKTGEKALQEEIEAVEREVDPWVAEHARALLFMVGK